jgi:hypothetical protein
VITHSGGCHCGRVRFTVQGPDVLEVSECNCSICAKTGYLHYLVPRAAFTLVAGRDHLTSYRFNTGVAEHLFCRVCGIKSFYVPRSHPDGISVNARCFDAGTVRALNVTQFDGRHWEASIASLAPLSRS